MTACIFCEIVAGTAPATILYQDEQVTAFRDTHPIARTHVLIIPNHHLASLNDLAPDEVGLAGHLILIALKVARQEGVDISGYRLMINTGRDGGQTIHHLHVHVIGGKQLHFPFGW
jgi:histidine triad (HIT) family protein